MKKLLFALFCLILTFTSGCWSSYEIEELALASAVGVDYDGTKYNLTIQIIKPEIVAEKTGTDPVTTIYSSGATMFDAIRNALSYSPKRLYWGYLQTMIFSERALEKGLACLIDFLSRDFEIRPIIWIAVTEKDPEELLKAKVSQDVPSGEGINAMIESQKGLSKCVHSMLTQALICLGNEGRDFACALFGTTKMEDEEFMEIKGTALFRGEQYVGSIDTLESRGLLWLMDRIKSGIIVLKAPQDEKLALEILSSKTKIKTKVDGDKIGFEVTIEVVSNLAEQTANLNPDHPDQWKELAEKQAQHVKDEAEKALRAIRNLGTDPVGFGKLLRAYHPKVWYQVRDHWHDLLKTVPIAINVKSKLKSTGMILGDVAIYGSLE